MDKHTASYKAQAAAFAEHRAAMSAARLSDAVSPARRVREYTDTDEAAAKATRRQFIESGRAVSLLGFDTARGVYAFDVLN